MTLLQSVISSGEDFEWYPTTDRMIAAVNKAIGVDSGSLLDIGAGDGRVLISLEKVKDKNQREYTRTLYAIEKSSVLVQSWPEKIVPLGTDLFEQNLTCLPVDYIFCNPPYSEFEGWVSTIIESGHAKKAFLVIPRRWKDSPAIAESLKKRGAKARVIHNDDFSDADRRARAVVDIVEVSYPQKWDDDYCRNNEIKDPFDIWFDQNINAFDREDGLAEDEQSAADLARINSLESIGDMVNAFNEEYARMEENYRAIFKLDYAILSELGVKKDQIREGIKKRMAGLKSKYWGVLFERLDAITKRLSTGTKTRFLERLTGRTAVAFTASNAYAVVLWAIKNANKYFDEQLVQLFRDLSTHDGVLNYKSNQRTWQKDGWRYMAKDHSHYSLDYRIVRKGHGAIQNTEYDRYDYPGNLYRGSHELINDITAVLYNLGFSLYAETPSRHRHWYSNDWQDFRMIDGSVLFQVKGFKNGNLHFRFKPEAIRVLNVEAGRLLGWLRSPADVEEELGYPAAEASACFGSNHKLGASSIKLLANAETEAA